MLGNVWVATLVTFILALVWLRVVDFFAHRGWIDGPLSRKIIHMGTGPIFVLCWLLYPDVPSARWLASLVPFAITVQFALVGLGLWKDQAAVSAMSRTGDRREILRGPLFYGIVFVILTLVYWKESPNGIIALMLLCGGDGLADITGKRIASKPLPWSPRKTIAGSLGMLLGGFLFSFLVIWVFSSVGVFPNPIISYLGGIAIISVVGTIVESLPVSDLDNFTVPGVAVLLSHILF